MLFGAIISFSLIFFFLTSNLVLSFSPNRATSRILAFGNAWVSKRACAQKAWVIDTTNLRVDNEFMSPPDNYDAVESDCIAAINQHFNISNNSSSSCNLFSVDVLTPGLNPRLEQKAILLQDYLFDLVTAVVSTILPRFNRIQLLFQSIGDAASYQQFCRLRSIDLPDNVILSDVSLNRLSNRDDCAIFIATKNNVGDPVIRTVQKICETYPALTAVFLNSDLSDKVTTGVQEKRGRDAFRSSIRPMYYFRNLVSISRPSMTPYELGAIRYTPSSGWEVYAVDEGAITARGSLNRYMKQGAFARGAFSGSQSSSSTDSGSSNIDPRIYRNSESVKGDWKTLPPPPLILAKRFEGLVMPDRDVVDITVTNALSVLRRQQEQQQQANKLSGKLSPNQRMEAAQSLLYNVATKRVQDVDPVALASACKALFFYEAGRNEYIDSNGPPQKLETVRDSGKQDGRSILGGQLELMSEVAQIGYDVDSTAELSSESSQFLRAIVGDWEAVVSFKSAAFATSTKSAENLDERITRVAKALYLYMCNEVVDITAEIQSDTSLMRKVMKLSADGRVEKRLFVSVWPFEGLSLSGSTGVYEQRSIKVASRSDSGKEDVATVTCTDLRMDSKADSLPQDLVTFAWLLFTRVEDNNDLKGGWDSRDKFVKIALTHEFPTGVSETQSFTLWRRL